jgi:hypothetical protein
MTAEMASEKYFAGARWGTGIALAVISGIASAAPPIPYDGYTVTNGVINAPCPAISCTTLVSDNGFLERQVKTGSGTYIQFILTDIGVSGDPAQAAFSAGRGTVNFTNEDFVKLGNRTNGLASKQSLISSEFVDPTTEDRFQTSTVYSFGWAKPTAATPWIDMTQAVSTLDYSANPLSPQEIFNTTIHVLSSDSAFQSNQNVDLTQKIFLGGSDSQSFKYKEVSGGYLTVGHTAGVDSPTPLLPGGTNGGDITWAAFFDKVSATYIGQDLTSNDPNVNDTLFGYTRYATQDGSLDTILSETHLSSLSDPNPVNWLNPPFGSAPTLAYNVHLSPTAVVAPPGSLAGTGEYYPAGSGSSTPVGPPIGFNQWLASGGSITASCPGCTDVAGAVDANGILQRFITVAGQQYIQTIVIANNATGDPNAAPFTANALGFRQESFVKTGTGEQGIAAQMHIERQNIAYQSTAATNPLPTDGGQFKYDVALNTGWANNSPLAPTVTVDQSVIVPDALVTTTTSMDESFHLEAKTTNGVTIGRRVRLDSVMGAENSAGNGFYNPIMFATAIVAGLYQDTTHTLLDPALLPSGGVDEAGVSNGGNIPWSSGDTIQATWMGGRYSTSDPAGQQNIAVTSYVDQTTGDKTTYVTDQYPLRTTNPNPDSWLDPPFGVAPAWMNPYTP